MDLKDLYRDVILDHNRQPRNFGRLEPPDAHADGPQSAVRRPARPCTCAWTGERLADIRFEGNGCAISTASASLMTEAVKGKDRAAIVQRCSTRCTRCSPQPDAPADAALGKLAALSGVREFPRA